MSIGNDLRNIRGNIKETREELSENIKILLVKYSQEYELEIKAINIIPINEMGCSFPKCYKIAISAEGEENG